MCLAPGYTLDCMTSEKLKLNLGKKRSWWWSPNMYWLSCDTNVRCVRPDYK